MKALIRDGVVVDLAAAVFPVHPAFVWVDAPEGGCRRLPLYRRPVRFPGKARCAGKTG
ncbi:hypothetical protein NB636_05145 [Oxalobacter aliiformigenes]|uniref:hypothetical protein n=1 Tax=Oxalobacter aliiformigenes TaxID=2946593 RepID=UPI0022AE5F55|nr:hypothetical protein [Oxalobacter aliiformigenes]WAW00232.1 hypothetical protein NB636_05145 [Oxalobacter aliiformigenes]